MCKPRLHLASTFEAVPCSVRFPRYRDVTMTARFLNERFWKQTEGETRCHRRCRILPGSRDRTRKRLLPERTPFVARHLSSLPYVRSRIVSFLARILSYEGALEQNRTLRLRRSKMLRVLNTLRCAYDCARAFRKDENEIRRECAHGNILEPPSLNPKSLQSIRVQSSLTQNFNGLSFTTVCNFCAYFWSWYNFDTVHFRRYKYEQSYFMPDISALREQTYKLFSHINRANVALKCEFTETIFIPTYFVLSSKSYNFW